MLKDLPRRALARLTSPRAGIACAVLSAALCGTRSALYALVPHFHRYRLWSDWSAPRWHTVWVYLLVTIVSL